MSQRQNDNTNIPEQWTFKNENVAENFDVHVRQQLPWYDLATFAVGEFGKHYITPNSNVYDIGAGTGNIAKVLLETTKSRDASIISIDNSDEMANVYTAQTNSNNTLIIDDAQNIEYENASMIVCFLTMMFIPKNERAELVAKWQKSLQPNGCIILVDKQMNQGGLFGLANYRLTLANKLAQGVSHEDVMKKEMSLAGVQFPIPNFMGNEWYKFFQYGDFVGYVYEKPSQF